MAGGLAFTIDESSAMRFSSFSIRLLSSCDKQSVAYCVGPFKNEGRKMLHYHMPLAYAIMR